MQRAVAAREVELAVRADAQPVEIVAEERDVQSVAGREELALLRAAVAVLVAQLPEIGDAGVVDVAVVEQQTGADAGRRGLEAVGEDGRGVGDAVAVRVAHETDPLVLDFVLLRELLARVLLVHRDAVGHRARGDVLVEPIHVVADVRHALVVAEGLRDEETRFAADPVGVEADRVREQRLGGEELDLEAGRDLDARERGLALVGGGRDLGLVGPR